MQRKKNNNWGFRFYGISFKFFLQVSFSFLIYKLDLCFLPQPKCRHWPGSPMGRPGWRTSSGSATRNSRSKTSCAKWHRICWITDWWVQCTMNILESLGYSEKVHRILLLIPIAAEIVHKVLVMMLSIGYLYRTQHIEWELTFFQNGYYDIYNQKVDNVLLIWSSWNLVQLLSISNTYAL